MKGDVQKALIRNRSEHVFSRSVDFSQSYAHSQRCSCAHSGSTVLKSKIGLLVSGKKKDSTYCKGQKIFMWHLTLTEHKSLQIGILLEPIEM